MNEKTLFHLGIDIQEHKNKAKYALLPGAPERVFEIAKYLKDARVIGQNREYTTVLGYGGDEDNPIGIFVCSTGIGGPSAVIAVEELCILGVRNFIRVGTCGGIRTDVRSGDVVIVTSSVRQEGTSLQYAPIEYPATADYEMVNAMVDSSRDLGLLDVTHVGVVQCKDSFYGQHNPHQMPVKNELIEKWEAWKKLGVLASEMESAAIFCAAAARGCSTGSVLSVVWNQERANLGLDNRETHDNKKAIQIALEAIKKKECIL